MIRVCFLWHMHQPYYKDLVSGEYRLPWTRLHALKDYLGMVEITREFPAVRQTFNLVPSLMVQIEEYAAGTAREPLLDLALKPAAQLTEGERHTALRYLFQANVDNLISRFPRYRQLYDTHKTADLSPQDFTDLQVLSQLAWFDEIYLENDPQIVALIRKARNYTTNDQQIIGRKQRELIGRIAGAYRDAQDRGQVELSTSPFYHPILPLVCDTEVTKESNPARTLPKRFRHPEDARMQLERAMELHTRLFGRPPSGVWPSEGSVSDEALGIVRDLGFRWAATGEGVLARSCGTGFPRDNSGVPANAGALYSSYEFGGPGAERSGGRPPMRLFFRDHHISDLIGFVYSKMDSREAARDLLERLRRCGRAAAGTVPDPVISVILDGENAWEYYLKNGREFFRALYGALSDDAEIRAVTLSDATQLRARAQIAHIVPGSWINANFDIWIGSEEDNRAWNLLADAREFFCRIEQAPPASLAADKLSLAREELLIAEGSDWNWWYGPEHHSAQDAEFDELYRAHIGNVYRMLGAQPPDALAVPITTVPQQVFSSPPANLIRPRLDGQVSSYFEWMGAGIYSPDQRASSMHGKRYFFKEMYYGLDEESFYVRLDFLPDVMPSLDGAEVRVNFQHDSTSGQLSARISSSAVVVSDGQGEGAFARILELRAPFDVVGLWGAKKFRFQVVLWVGGLPVDLLPVEGWLEVK